MRNDQPSGFQLHQFVALRGRVPLDDSAHQDVRKVQLRPPVTDYDTEAVSTVQRGPEIPDLHGVFGSQRN